MADLLDRVVERIDFAESGCWEWGGSISSAGYGRIGRGDYVHRVLWTETVGPIPEGLELDHLCRNRACCNPDHLEPVTHRENLARAPFGPWTIQSSKTHCPQGHPYDEVNTLLQVKRNGHRNRFCKICKAERQRRYRARSRGQG